MSSKQYLLIPDEQASCSDAASTCSTSTGSNEMNFEKEPKLWTVTPPLSRHQSAHSILINAYARPKADNSRFTCVLLTSLVILSLIMLTGVFVALQLDLLPLRTALERSHAAAREEAASAAALKQTLANIQSRARPADFVPLPSMTQAEHHTQPLLRLPLSRSLRTQ